jgi:UDP:flavonoid glycosyltransferase YjiC (YdhE family)
MTNTNSRLLFIPVSGPLGLGEYARCLTLATALVRRLPWLEVHFALSRAAPYAAATPFPATLLPASPTFHPHEVAALIGRLQPRVVVFDNAGRTQQLRAARAAGARVVFVSSRRRQRRKAFRLKWLPLIDEHWIAYPQFIAGALTLLERLKLNLIARPRIRFIDALLPEEDPAVAADMLQRLGLGLHDYVLVVPGGATAHPGAKDAPAIVAAAAAAIAARGYATLLLGAAADGDGDPALLRRAPLLPPAQLCELIRAARLIVCNGGDTLLQALACRRPCVAVPIAHDQARRIAACVHADLAERAELHPRAIETVTVALLEGAGRRAALESRLAQMHLRNGLPEVLEALTAML